MEVIAIITEEGPDGEPIECVMAHFIHDPVMNTVRGFNVFRRLLPMPALQDGTEGASNYEMNLN